MFAFASSLLPAAFHRADASPSARATGFAALSVPAGVDAARRSDRFAQVLRACVFVLVAMLLAAPLAAQISFGPQVSVSPGTATASGTISVAGDRLTVGATYRVDLRVTANDVRPLFTISDGDGEFQRYVTLPGNLATGASTSVELYVNNVLRDSASLRILAPLGITLTPASPRAGQTVPFTVTGLTAGTLTLVYAGRTAFGPVIVGSGTYSNRFRVPTDRPSSLPATVRLDANNATGRMLVPRRGSRNVSVQPPNLSPLVSLRNFTPSATSVTRLQRLRITGNVDTNDYQAQDARADFWWRTPSGQVLPMGAQQGTVTAGGAFDHGMVTPSFGALGAANVLGNGTMFGSLRARDEHDNLQFQNNDLGSFGANEVLDDAIDIRLTLTGSDGQRIQNARIDLFDFENGENIDALYPPGETNYVYDIDTGERRALPMVSQFDIQDAIADQNHACPANRERQYTNQNGVADFEFGLDIEEQLLSVDGYAPRAGLVESLGCVSTGDQLPEGCQQVLPETIAFKMKIRARSVGYGWERTETNGGQTQRVEEPLTLSVSINRYTGRTKVVTCIPGNDRCTLVAYDSGSVSLAFTLPLVSGGAIPIDTLSLFTNGGAELPIPAQRLDNGHTQFAELIDLGLFQNLGGTFQPATAPRRRLQFHYDAGAGAPLTGAGLIIGGIHSTYVPMTRVSGGNFDCDSESNPEVWEILLSQTISNGFRTPGAVFGNGPPLGATKNVNAVIRAVDSNGTLGFATFGLRFIPLPQEFQGFAGIPGTVINTVNPTARRLSIQGAIPNNQQQSGPPQDVPGPNLTHPQASTSRVTGARAYEFCMPKSSSCGANTVVGFDHQQYNRNPDAQPAPLSASAGGGFSRATGSSSDPWVTLFEYSIPLFRWYWGIPELLSAEVFADLAVKAEYYLRGNYDPLEPQDASVDTGGRFGIGIFLGVDIDVLFGILLDAGASIYGGLITTVETETRLSSVTPTGCLNFVMYFTGWLEIGCPLPNPFDPTCYIPDIEETFPIFSTSSGNGCGTFANGGAFVAAASATYPAAPFGGSLLDRLPSRPLFDATNLGAKPAGATSASGPLASAIAGDPTQFTRDIRRRLHRSPALAFDGSGNSIALYLDANGDLRSREGLRDPQSVKLVARARGIRNVAVAYYSTDRAVAVWSQSSLPDVPAGSPPPTRTRDQVAAAQHLRWAAYYGDEWTTPQNLTAPGFGEGQVKLARCRALATRAPCPQRVSLVFQRNTQRTIAGRKNIFFAQFNGEAWTAPVQVDETGSHNITPAITYAAGEPVVAWVHYLPGGDPNELPLSRTNQRVLGMRVMDGPGRQQLDTVRGVAQPAIAGKLNGQVAIAYTTAAADAFIGTRHALRIGHRTCSGNTCPITSWAVQDHHGRQIYVERPSVAINGDGDAQVSYRALGHGPVPGVANPENNLFPEDPLGVRTATGELMDFVSPLQPSFVRTRALTTNGNVYFQTASAFDAVNQEHVAIGATVDTAPIRAALRSPGDAPSDAPLLRAAAQYASVEDGIDLAMIADLPDLTIAELSTTTTQLRPSTNASVRVVVANRGSAWTTSTERTATVRLYWNTPQTRTVTSASFAVTNIAAGASLIRTINVPIPAAFATDQRQTLRAVVDLSQDNDETDGENNEATVGVGGMPVPTGVLAASAAGTRMVHLAWNAPTDTRIAGYRVWVDDSNGKPVPLGSSFNKGWIDLAARFDVPRTYRVSTYSVNGVESELSEPVTAEPAPAALSEDIFTNGFEG